MSISGILKRLVFIFGVAVLGNSLLGQHVSAQVLSGGQIREFLAGHTVYAKTASNRTWNAFFQSGGQTTYWNTRDTIIHGTWRIVGPLVCVDLGNGESCREVIGRSDGTYLWQAPGSASPTEIARRDVGDTFGLASRPGGSTLAPEEFLNVSERRLLDQGYRFVQIASRLSYADSQRMVDELVAIGFDNATAYISRSGWYAISLGLASDDFQQTVSRLIAEGQAPRDTYFTVGGTYTYTAYQPRTGINRVLIPPPAQTPRHSNAPVTTHREQSFCEELPLVCVIGGVLAIGVIGDVLSVDGDSSPAPRQESFDRACFRLCMLDLVGTLGGRSTCERRCRD